MKVNGKEIQRKAREAGNNITLNNIHTRKQQGWTDERIINTPIKKQRRAKHESHLLRDTRRI